MALTQTHTHTNVSTYISTAIEKWCQTNSLKKGVSVKEWCKCRCAASAQQGVSETEWMTTGTSTIYLLTIDTSEHVEVWKHLDLNPSSRWVGPGQTPNVGWWKSQITPVKVWATMPPGALFTLLFKGVCSLIRPRKRARWWEPMEKNTLSINCAGLIPQSGASGCGNSARSVCCSAAIAFTAQGRRTGYIQSREPQAPHWPIVHRWTIYSIFGLAQRNKVRWRGHWAGGCVDRVVCGSVWETG